MLHLLLSGCFDNDLLLLFPLLPQSNCFFYDCTLTLQVMKFEDFKECGSEAATKVSRFLNAERNST